MKFRSIFAMTALAVAFGCGDDASKRSDNSANNPKSANTANGANAANAANAANGANAEFDPGIAFDKTLDELTDEEFATACDAVAAYEESSGANAVDCLSNAYNAAQNTGATDDETLRAACTERYDVCREQLRQTGGFGHLCSNALNCTGTVAQAVDCYVQALGGKVETFAVLPPCEEITLADLSRPQSLQLPAAPACAALNATCNPD